MKNQEESIRNKYYRKAHLKNINIWLKIIKIEETRMSLSLKMHVIIDNFFENTFDNIRLLSYERLMTSIVTYSTIR